MINEVNRYELIKRSLDAATERAKVISNNIANINTKDFKRSYVVFEDKLKEALEKDRLELEVSDEKHIKSNKSELNYDVKKDTSTSIRSDGNNVDIDNEMVNIATNNLMVTVQLLTTFSFIVIINLQFISLHLH